MNTSNNKVILSGFIANDLTCSHEVYNEKFYLTSLSVKRLSDMTDTIPIQISERLLGDCTSRSLSPRTESLVDKVAPNTSHCLNDETAATNSATLFATESVQVFSRVPFRFAHEQGKDKCERGNEAEQNTTRICPPSLSLRTGDFITLSGQFRSYNKMEQDKSKLMLTVFAQDIVMGSQEYINTIQLTGYICKPPIFRTTPFMREICDCLIAVNRAYNKSDYIPCIAWGRNARFLKNLQVGQQINLEGRIQSRQYNKKIDENHEESRTAYEVSIAKVALQD